MALCNEKTRKVIQDQITKCVQVIDKYDWLHNTLLHDFFVEHHWQRLPLGWRSSLSKLTPADLANFLNYWNSDSCNSSPLVNILLPLELLALKCCVKQFSLNRKPVQNVHEAFKCVYSPSIAGQSLLKPETTIHSEWKTYEEELTKTGGQHKNLNNIFRKHVKPKKQHEIARLASLVKVVSDSVGVHQIVDVGSGVGHLSRILSYAHGLKTVSIDAKENHVASARTFDDQLVKQLQKNSTKKSEVKRGTIDIGNKVSCKNTAQSTSGPCHLAQFVDFNDKKAFMDTLSTYFNDNSNFGIVGLHTCGDLGSALVRSYAQCEEAKALFSVACCHMRLTATFPLSHYLTASYGQRNQQGDNCLSYLTKELSCHAIETYVRRLQIGEENCKLKVHCYRALLELLIQETNPNLRHSALKSVPKCHTISFQEYAVKATKELDITFDFRDKELQERIDCYLKDWWKVVVYYSLRLFFAPIIETAILLDRCLYLQEQGHMCCLVPIFDPLLSPRNHVLLSIKNR